MHARTQRTLSQLLSRNAFLLSLGGYRAEELLKMTWLVRPGDALERKAEPRVTASERGIEDEDLGRMKKAQGGGECVALTRS